jgi:hypothetical protein
MAPNKSPDYKTLFLQQQGRLAQLEGTVQATVSDGIADGIAKSHDRSYIRNKTYKPKLSSDTPQTGYLDNAPPLVINSFHSSPINTPIDVINYTSCNYFIPALSILHPEFVEKFNLNLRPSLEPTNANGNYDTSKTTMDEVWIPLDGTLSYQDFWTCYVLWMRVILECLVSDTDKIEATTELVSFMVDMQSRVISEQSWPLLREYALRRIAVYRDKTARRTDFTKNPLNPFDDKLFNTVAASFGAQGSNVESLFVSRSEPGTGQTPIGALVKAVIANKKPSEFVKTLTAEQRIINKEVFDGKASASKVPPSIGFKKEEQQPVQGFGAGGGFGGRGGFAGRGRGRGGFPPPIQIPQATGWGTSGGGGGFGSSANSTAIGFGQQQQYAGGPQRTGSESTRGGFGSPPYPPPRTLGSATLRTRTAAETQQIKQLFQGAFLAAPGWSRCLYCGQGGHSHNECPAPILQWKADEGQPKQVFSNSNPERPICSNYNRSICASGPSGSNCPRAHLCSLCGIGDHVASNCPHL